MKRLLKSSLALLIAVLTVIPCVPFGIGAASVTETLGEIQESIPDLRITIDSGYSLDTIHQSKEEKIRAHVQISGAWDSAYNLASTGVEIKTRGNSTFLYNKKPYQIKFDSKTDLFGMGAEKKWILLANYVDGSFIRNKIVFDIAEEMGMAYVCKSVFVNLYMNGDYVGVYQLCEKVEIGDWRVPLEHDFGVIAEMESEKRIYEEELYFRTNVTKKPFVYKEYNTDFEDPAMSAQTAEVRAFFENRINTLENEIYNNGKDWELVESLIDVDSFIQFYFINELCENVDATLASTFFYIDGPDDVIHMGPLWDYDRCFGTYNDGSYEQSADADFLKNIIDSADEYRVDWFKMLFRYPEFVKRVNEMYDSVIKDAFDPVRINATIDAYHEVMWDSLMRNYVDEGWAIFHSISDAEFFDNEEDAGEYLTYTTNAIKLNILNRVEYLNKAYGAYHPILFYSANGGITYSGGSMTDSQSVSTVAMSLDSTVDGGISYSASVNGKTVAAVSDGATLSGSSAMSGLKIELYGNVANYFSVQYRVCVDGAWSSWVSDGTLAGSRKGSAITRIQARIIEKNEMVLGTVSFNTNDVCAIPVITDAAGDTVLLTPYEVDGYDFIGYYSDSGYTTPIDSVAVVAGDTVVYAKYAEKSKVFGDLNGDFLVSAKDVNLIMQIIAGVKGVTETDLLLGDHNSDGLITALDLNKIKRIAAGI